MNRVVIGGLMFGHGDGVDRIPHMLHERKWVDPDARLGAVSLRHKVVPVASLAVVHKFVAPIAVRVVVPSGKGLEALDCLACVGGQAANAPLQAGGYGGESAASAHALAARLPDFIVIIGRAHVAHSLYNVR